MGKKRQHQSQPRPSSLPSDEDGPSPRSDDPTLSHALTFSSSHRVADKDVVYLSPAQIYFTFSRICPTFSCGRTIEGTCQQFRDGLLTPADLPIICVFKDSTGHFFSQNNRRLYLYKHLHEEGLLGDIPVRLRPLPNTKRMNTKYSTETCALRAKLIRGARPVSLKVEGEEEALDDINKQEEQKQLCEAPEQKENKATALPSTFSLPKDSRSASHIISHRSKGGCRGNALEHLLGDTANELNSGESRDDDSEAPCSTMLVQRRKRNKKKSVLTS